MSAHYWRAGHRGRIQETTPPRSSRAALSLRLGPAAPLGCRSMLQPPARLCVLGSREERRGREQGKGGGDRQLTHAFQSLHSQQPGVLPLPLLSLLLLLLLLLPPPEETAWTAAPCCHLWLFLPSTAFYAHCHYHHHHHHYSKRREITDHPKRTTYTFPNCSSVSREEGRRSR